MWPPRSAITRSPISRIPASGRRCSRTARSTSRPRTPRRRREHLLDCRVELRVADERADQRQDRAAGEHDHLRDRHVDRERHRARGDAGIRHPRRGHGVAGAGGAASRAPCAPRCRRPSGSGGARRRPSPRRASCVCWLTASSTCGLVAMYSTTASISGLSQDPLGEVVDEPALEHLDDQALEPGAVECAVERSVTSWSSTAAIRRSRSALSMQASADASNWARGARAPARLVARGRARPAASGPRSPARASPAGRTDRHRAGGQAPRAGRPRPLRARRRADRRLTSRLPARPGGGTSAPPSSAIRAPKRISAGCGEILPATSASPSRNDAARRSGRGATNENTASREGRVGGRVQPHQHEVVALRDDVLVHLLRALRRDEHVEAELAALGGDPHRVLGRERGQRVLRLAGQTLCASSITISTGCGARAARHSRPSTASAAAPAPRGCRASRGRRPRRGRSRRAPRRARRARVSRAHTPKRSTPRLRARMPSGAPRARRSASSSSERGSSSASSASSSACSSRSAIGSSRSSAALRGGGELGDAEAQPLVAGPALRCTARPSASRAVALGRRLVDAVAHARQPDEVGVRVEDDDPQVGLEQQPLEHDAERVGLAGAGLPAQERVAVEAAGVERARHAGRQRSSPTSSRARRGAVARSQAATSSGVGGRISASWNGRRPAAPARCRLCLDARPIEIVGQDAGLPRRGAGRDGDGPDRQGLHRRRDPGDRRLARRAAVRCRG